MMSCSPDELWSLDPETIFLNHGSFGACPLEVRQVQQTWRDRMEEQPVRFFTHDLEPLLQQAREVLGEFIGATPENLAWVNNATTAVNTVLRSLDFTEDDELLVTNQAYNACRNAIEYAAGRHRARVVVADLPFPLDNEDQIIDAIMQRVTPRTRLALIDHVTSPTALILPVERITRKLRDKGVEVFIDGAHAPGMLPLNIEHLGVSYYTGNCHKWLCAPKSSAFLYVAPQLQERIRPLSISHGANALRTDRSRFLNEFDWVGTLDPSAILSVPAAISFMRELMPGGWTAVRAHNHQLALEARQLLCDALGVKPPAADNMIGSMVSLPLPSDTSPVNPAINNRQPLHDRLLQQYHIEVPVVPWPAWPQRLIRISAQVYNKLSQYERLAEALEALSSDFDD